MKYRGPCRCDYFLTQNMKYIALLASLFFVGVASAQHYKVITPMTKDDDGAMARLINFDTGETVDSVLVENAVATFEGEVDEPYLARVIVDGVRKPVFILEAGTISFSDKGGAFGSMLNDELRAMGNRLNALAADFQKADEAGQQAILNKYNAVLDSTMMANRDNPLGCYVFLNGDASQASAPELREMLKKYPDFAKYQRVKKMLDAAEKREATQPGRKYVDFTITNDGKAEKLSDYVKPGKYTLVDFWASWCGPCMRQAAVLKDLYKKYHDKGLDIVGVAVWDEPANTLEAIKSHGLKWPNIINAQTVPTDLYGITGIPCIMLIGPDGTILSRDKQGEDLVADVEKYIKK